MNIKCAIYPERDGYYESRNFDLWGCNYVLHPTLKQAQDWAGDRTELRVSGFPEVSN